MDFFQAQDNAIRKTKQLVFYYAVAVVLIIISVYMAVTAGYFLYEYLLQPEATRSALNFRTPVWDVSRFFVVLVGVLLLVGLGSLFKTLSLRGGGAVVATSLGGEKVDRSTREPRRRQLLNVVEEMAIASGVPVPEVYILTQEASINAFAAGWSKDDAVIAVSAGALEHLNRDELQGVVAHEYSHVLFGDCRLNIRLMGVLYGIMMLTIFGQMMRVLLRGGSSRGGRGVIIVGSGRRRSGNGKGGGGAIILVVIVVIILITIIGFIGTFFGRLIQAAISRQREYLADAAAVQFTRNPEGISGALKRIVQHPDRSVLLHPKAGEAAHMFFSDGIERSLSSAMATHPPLKERILKIQPSWDGSYPKLRKSRIVEEPRAGKVVKEKDTGRKMIEGMAVIGAIGTISQENLSKAQQITSAIPDNLDTSMREPEGARLCLYALVIADHPDDDEKQMALVQEALSEDEYNDLQAIHVQIEALSLEERVGILELASSTLVQSSKSGHEDFHELVNKLINVDGEVSFYEFCLKRILLERLNRGSPTPAADSSVNYMQLNPEVAWAIGSLLSVIARESSDVESAPGIVEKSVRSLYLLNGKVTYQGPESGGMEKLNEALDILRHSAFAIRAQALKAIVACIQEDGQLSPKEAVFLRMVSLSFDCPMPPVSFID